MARRKKRNLNKRKYGGPGTKVGNFLRTLPNTTKNIITNIPKVLNPITLPSAIASVSSSVIKNNKLNKTLNSLNFNNPVQSALNTERNINRQINQPGMPDSGLFTNQRNQAKVNVYRAMGQNTGGSVAGAVDSQVDESDIEESNSNVTHFRNQPQYNYSQTNKIEETPTTPISSAKTNPPVAEFMRGGVSTLGSTAGSPSAMGGEAIGGSRLGRIPGTQIDDPVLKNLLEQYGKDAQLDVNLDEIRERNRRASQAEIDAINAVYSDLVGRAVKTGEENMGSERAIQARSGTLPSSFGQGAMAGVRAETDRNIGEIENQKTQAISEIYSRSEARAMDEFTKLQDLRTSGIEGYIQAMELQKESMDKGLDETAQYIALSGMSGDDLGIDGLEKIAKDWNTTPMAVYNRIAEKKSLLDNSVIERAKAMTDAGMGATETGSDFDYFSKESIAMSALPIQIRNSDKEQEYYREGIRQGLEAGMDPYDIADVLMGFNVTNKDEFTSSVRQLIGQSELPQNKIADVARNINAGNYANALSIVENSIMARAKKETDSFVSESTTKTALQRSNELENKINGLDKSPIGVTKGTMENWLGKLRGKEASKIKADIVRQVAQMRKEFSGSAVTPSEEKFLAPIIPDLSDKPDVFMYKLQALGSEPLRQLNNIRQQYGMIQVDMESLMDKNIRVQDYYSIGGSMPQNTQQQEVDNFSW